jgi:hypothetical protein
MLIISPIGHVVTPFFRTSKNVGEQADKFDLYTTALYWRQTSQGDMGQRNIYTRIFGVTKWEREGMEPCMVFRPRAFQLCTVEPRSVIYF